MDNYITIAEDDILLNNESISHYNNILIQNREKALYYFGLAKMFFFKEFGITVKAFHLMQANNLSHEPIFDINGNFSWERIEDIDGNCSDWVVTDFYTVAKCCSANMCLDAANLSRSNTAFRYGLAKTLNKKESLIKISNNTK